MTFPLMSLTTLATSVILCSSVAVALMGCTSEPHIGPLKYDDFIKATPVEEPERPVKIVEIPKPLPLPGQLKPLPEAAKIKSEKKTALKDTAKEEEKLQGKGSDPKTRPAGEKETKEKLAQEKPMREKPMREKPIKDKIESAKTAAKIEPAPNGYINAIQVYPYAKGALYKLYASVNQISDITLEAGEKLLSVSAGDTVRWIIGDTKSGSGEQAQVHILVKPIASQLETNLMIATDRRTYHLELSSSEGAAMSSMSWTYPQDSLTTLRQSNDKAERIDRALIENDVPIADLQFRYRVEGEASWKPTHVFDDGRKVYIQFPSGLRQGEAPPLFVMASNGKPSLVNYRVKGQYYIVDRLFAVAELRLGEEPQTIVKILRKDAVISKEASHDIF